jgi:hypothetical protein
MTLSSQPFADIGVADPDGEQASGDGKHQNVHHWVCSMLRPDIARLSIALPGQGGSKQINYA